MTYQIQDDFELKQKVRTLTGYARDDDELSEPDLDGLLDISKLIIKNATGSDSWYSDEGLGQALLGVTCIRAKESVENYSVSSWSVGDEEIDVSGASDPDAVQFTRWNELVNEGLSASQEAETTHSMSIRNTSAYIGE